MKYLRGTKLISEQHPEILSDESSLKGGYCSEVYWPDFSEDIAPIIRKSYENKIQVTISGARTGITGAAVPFGGTVISTEKLKGLSETPIDTIITAKAGETIDSITEFCNKFKPDYFYPPDPTETTASIGGTIATDASGASSYLYGSTRNWINKITVILPSGKTLYVKRNEYFFNGNRMYHPILGTVELPILTNEPPPKNAAGLYIKPAMDLIDLFIGSEGNLGVITEAELILHKKPYSNVSFAVFGSEAQFWCLHNELLHSKLRVKELEVMASPCLQFLTKNTGRQFPDGDWVLITTIELFSEDEIDSTLEIFDSILTKWGISSDSTWSALSSVERSNLKEFRHTLPETVNRIVASNSLKNPSIHKISTDTAVTPGELKLHYQFMQNKLSNSGIKFVVFGHAGQGHLHVNLLPTTKEELLIAEKISEAIATQAVQMGGTVSAEHGTGKLKDNLLAIMYSDIELNAIQKLLCKFRQL